MDPTEAYQLLEVPHTASPEEVRRAYLLMLKVWHPDRFQHDPDLRLRADERTKAPYNQPSQIPNDYNWWSLLKKDGDDLQQAAQLRPACENLAKADWPRRRRGA